MNNKHLLILGGITTLASVALAGPVDTSKLPPAAAKQGVTYAGDIKAIFDKSCVKCHGAEKPKAKLRMDSLEGVLKGSADGKVIETGNSAKSPLVHSIAQLGDEDHWMPPKNNKAKIAPLTADQIGLIRAWIDQGAK
jgi:mono/diheme cytochrome c family protein